VRRCAWANGSAEPARHAVWARGEVFAMQCPKSLITVQSLKWLDEFNAWKTLGAVNLLNINAKTADAIALLDVEFRKELAREENKE
jgi:hypothetical protein